MLNKTVKSNCKQSNELLSPQIKETLCAYRVTAHYIEEKDQEQYSPYLKFFHNTIVY